jgi:membrane protein
MGTPGVAGQHGRVARLARWPLAHLKAVGGGISRCLPRAVEDLFVDRCPQYAASIAYHVLFSLFPLTILLVSIFGLVLQDDDLRQKVVDQLLDVLPVSESGEADVQSSIDGIATPLSALGLVSLIALLWGASGMMGSVRIGLETAFKVRHGRPAARAKLMDLLLVAAAGLLVLVAVVLSAFTAFFSGLVDRFLEWGGIAAQPSAAIFDDGLQLLLLGATALLLYRFVPARSVRPRGAVAGAILTAVGIWGAAKVLAVAFDFSRYNVIYGSLAGVTTFLFFVYVAALIVLLGAEFAYAWSQPPGPPTAPLRDRIVGFFKGLFVASGADDERAGSQRLKSASAWTRPVEVEIVPQDVLPGPDGGVLRSAHRPPHLVDLR